MEVAIIADFKGAGDYFARGIYEHVKGKEDRDFLVKCVHVSRTNFPDGEFKNKIEENIRGNRCFFIHDAHKNPADWFTELAFVLNAIKFSDPSHVIAVFPYLLFSRQDRKDESRVGVSAKVVADIVSRYADGGMGLDLHASQIQQYFDVPFDNLYSFPVLVDYLVKNHKEDLENLVVVAPDAGDGERAKSLKQRIEAKIGKEIGVAFGSKTRMNGELEIEIVGDVGGKNCIIPDDIISTGGTMILTGKELKNKKAERLIAYGTHAFFLKGLEGFKIFDYVLTGDTRKPPEGIEIVSMISLFGEAIYRRCRGDSISELYQD